LTRVSRLALANPFVFLGGVGTEWATEFSFLALPRTHRFQFGILQPRGRVCMDAVMKK